jgi:hypothetical protein
MRDAKDPPVPRRRRAALRKIDRRQRVGCRCWPINYEQLETANSGSRIDALTLAGTGRWRSGDAVWSWWKQMFVLVGSPMGCRTAVAAYR